jgi:uncharacterized membrane protein
VIEERTCRDPVSEEAFETTVTVGIDGHALRGCGRTLRATPETAGAAASRAQAGGGGR